MGFGKLLTSVLKLPGASNLRVVALFLLPEDGGSRLLISIGVYLTNDMTSSYSRKHKSSYLLL